MWTNLLETALKILDSAGISPEEWELGGGTTLAYYFHHRESHDIDVFITDAQYLTMLSPRLNSIALQSTTDYTETSNYLKLRYPEGEIDFIVAPALTKDHYTCIEWSGRKIRIETPAEIIAKKLFYRAEALKTRDVVDTAVVFAQNPESLASLAVVLKTRIEVLKKRWSKLREIYPLEAKGLLINEPELIDGSPRVFDSFLSALKTRIENL